MRIITEIISKLFTNKPLLLPPPDPSNVSEGKLEIVVGGSYPSMFGHNPSLHTVLKIYHFHGKCTVVYRWATKVGTPMEVSSISAESLEYFCKYIAERLAYDRNVVNSVDVTAIFKQYSITSGR